MSFKINYVFWKVKSADGKELFGLRCPYYGSMFPNCYERYGEDVPRLFGIPRNIASYFYPPKRYLIYFWMWSIRNIFYILFYIILFTFIVIYIFQNMFSFLFSVSLSTDSFHSMIPYCMIAAVKSFLFSRTSPASTLKSAPFLFLTSETQRTISVSSIFWVTILATALH